MDYVVTFTEYMSNHTTDFFTGKRCTFQGGMYAVLGNIEDAKRYKSEKIAQRSADSLNKRSEQWGTFTVRPVETNRL